MNKLSEKDQKPDRLNQRERLVWLPLNSATLTPLSIGASIGFVAAFLFIAFIIASFQTGESAVTDRLQKLAPGVPIADVEKDFGNPNRRIEIGEGLGNWEKQLAIPPNYGDNHGALVYVVGGVGPQVLFIFFDEESRVTFVTCAPT